MIRRGAVALLLPVCAAAELQLLTVRNGVEEPAGTFVDIGSVAAGDQLSARFRLRNTGTTSETLRTITVAGTGFRVSGAPSPPYIAAPGTNIDFDVRFSSTVSGTYSANLAVNGRSTLLGAAATAVVLVSIGSTVLAAGDSVEFAAVERGTTARKTLTLENRENVAQTIALLSVSGAGFSVQPQTEVPLVLAPGEARRFELQCTPVKAGAITGTLEVGTRRFVLNALAVEPKPPRPVIVAPQGVIGSAQQVQVSIALSEVSRANITGSLRLELPGRGDSAAVFIASGRNRVDFEVREGDREARFSSSNYATLQTGTTSGRIILTADIAGYTDQATIEVAPAAVQLDKATAVREANSLIVQLDGFDNTRSVSRLNFTFYDRAGTALGAAITADAGQAFKSWFESSTAGGLFSLKAAFPVTGDAAQVGGVEVEIQNSSGASRSGRLRF